MVREGGTERTYTLCEAVNSVGRWRACVVRRNQLSRVCGFPVRRSDRPSSRHGFSLSVCLTISSVGQSSVCEDTSEGSEAREAVCPASAWVPEEVPGVRVNVQKLSF